MSMETFKRLASAIVQDSDDLTSGELTMLWMSVLLLQTTRYSPKPLPRHTRNKKPTTMQTFPSFMVGPDYLRPGSMVTKSKLDLVLDAINANVDSLSFKEVGVIKNRVDELACDALDKFVKSETEESEPS